MTNCCNKRPSIYYIIQTLDSDVVLSILQIKHTRVTYKPVKERVRRLMSQNSYSLPSDVNFFHNRYESSVSNCVDICVDQKSCLCYENIGNLPQPIDINISRIRRLETHQSLLQITKVL